MTSLVYYWQLKQLPLHFQIKLLIVLLLRRHYDTQVKTRSVNASYITWLCSIMSISNLRLQSSLQDMSVVFI